MQLSQKDYTKYKPLLFSLGYRILGSIADTEDAVQETFLRAYQTEDNIIENKKAYLCKIMTNLCLDLLKSARKKREKYVGSWLPEPLILDNFHYDDPSHIYLQTEGLSIAYLRMMENLSPQERVVIILRDVFGYSHNEIGTIVEKSDSTCRKLYSRAKQRINMIENESYQYEQNKDVINSFIQAIKAQNMDRMLKLVSENVVLYSDGGGKVKSAIHPIFTRKNVLAFLLGILKKAPSDVSYKIKNVNGCPALIFYSKNQIMNITSFRIVDDKLEEIYMTVTPDKLPNI